MEHRWHYEVRYREIELPIGDVFTVTEICAVCECDAVTDWHRQLWRVKADQARHALDGQLSML